MTEGKDSKPGLDLLDSADIINQDIVRPVDLGFLPFGQWNNVPTSISSLKSSYFSRKNNVSRRFEHKLWNSLKIVEQYPHLFSYIGVAWVSDTVIKVNKTIFASFLGIGCVEGGLFHKQGNFTRHGFEIMKEQDVRASVGLSISDIDFHTVVLVTNTKGEFGRSSDEQAIQACRWENPMSPPRVAIMKAPYVDNQGPI